MVAIKNFEMPKSCEECGLFDGYSCHITWTENEYPDCEKSEDCPLVEVEVSELKNGNVY